MAVLEASDVSTGNRSVAPPCVSIVLPVYNQADHIARVIEEYREDLLKNVSSEFEILLVVNGSSDESLSECEKLARTYPEVRSISSIDIGWGAAIKAGIKACKGDLICFTSSARTQADVLTSFVKQSIEMPDVVLHARRASQDNWFRSLGSRIFNTECRVLFGIKASDVNGTPKVFPREFTKLLDMTRKDFSLDIEFDYICAREKYPILEIPVGDTPRHGGQSTTTMMRAVGLLWKTLVLRVQTTLQPSA